MSLYVGPNGTQRLGDVLLRQLPGPWKAFRAAVAYAKMSGIDHLHARLAELAADPAATVSITVGIDQHGTSYEALAALLDILGPHGHGVFIRHNPRSSSGVPSPTFHPKIWLLDNGTDAMALIGSGNLTQGGLFTNYEVGAIRHLSRSDPSQRAELGGLTAYLDRCCDNTKGDVAELTPRFLDELADANLVLSEGEMRKAARTAARARVASSGRTSMDSVGKALFEGEEVAAPPSVAKRATRRIPPRTSNDHAAPAPTKAGSRTTKVAPPVMPQHSVLYIHLTPSMKTEIFLAKAPLKDDPAFFGLPFTGRTKPRQRGNPPQPQASPWPIVDVTVYDTTGPAATALATPVKMWQYTEGASANEDVRIYFGRDMQDHIADGSVLVMERDPRPDVDYDISVYPPGHPDFAQYDARCTQKLTNSQRRYGWS